ncbi:hypothetical protein PHAVU_003G038500 [Phaseolus vulgaris]|uniref:Uncharacterized protein n=1 Tax=Phaseolus vulgaris TaxID=3885 RepID=V7C5K2_PHAVU|nr:hypothetical protein PHAVU_003G038500g [Phaseolus vulgaris]ESW25467.1 hypothetical protein PHAVU_003G038500g [Phaseolus vulgaris]
MESGVEFPGFQIYSHKEEFVLRRSMSRLQKRAPCPLQIKPNEITAFACNGAQNSMATTSTSSSTSSSLNSFFTSKDPIPLLSPLVLLESTSTREENTAKSH